MTTEHNEKQAAGKALQRIRAVASEAGTEKHHGPQFVAGMRRAANLLEQALAACAAELKAAQDDGHDCAIRYVLGYLNGAGECGGTYYEEILDSCGRERIIQSAINDGELDFTGLGDYIRKYGTAAEKRKVRAALRAQAAAEVGHG